MVLSIKTNYFYKRRPLLNTKKKGPPSSFSRFTISDNHIMKSIDNIFALIFLGDADDGKNTFSLPDSI